jgi:hypothetical protein
MEEYKRAHNMGVTVSFHAFGVSSLRLIIDISLEFHTDLFMIAQTVSQRRLKRNGNFFVDTAEWDVALSC